jgi:hypothetical protein
MASSELSDSTSNLDSLIFDFELDLDNARFFFLRDVDKESDESEPESESGVRFLDFDLDFDREDLETGLRFLDHLSLSSESDSLSDSSSSLSSLFPFLALFLIFEWPLSSLSSLSNFNLRFFFFLVSASLSSSCYRPPAIISFLSDFFVRSAAFFQRSRWTNI